VKSGKQEEGEAATNPFVRLLDGIEDPVLDGATAANAEL